MSFLSAALSSLDAAAVDLVLTAIAAVADPGDTRTLRQRRADALVDVLLGRISNGCHTRWDGGDDGHVADDNGDNDQSVDDDAATDHEIHRDSAGTEPVAENPCDAGMVDADPADAGTVDADPVGDDKASEDPIDEGSHAGGDGRPLDVPGMAIPETVDHQPNIDGDADPDGDVDDWDLLASAFRPDPARSGHPLIGPTPGTAPGGKDGSGAATGVHPCTCGGRITSQPAAGVQIRPVQVNIGIFISAAALFGFSNAPGQLADRSALIPADTIRDLAARPGTLFHRLVTDTGRNLLQVTELGRFPSKKLALAVTYRDGVCNPDTCHVSAARGDLDHVIPIPEGPTTASNLKARCREDHRAKTHAGHQTERTGPHTTIWTTPTGHTYESTDDRRPTTRRRICPRKNCPPTR